MCFTLLFAALRISAREERLQRERERNQAQAAAAAGVPMYAAGPPPPGAPIYTTGPVPPTAPMYAAAPPVTEVKQGEFVQQTTVHPQTQSY